MKNNLKLAAPWYTYQKKVNALFDRDPEIKVGDIILPEDGRADYLFDIEIRNHEKFLALDRVFPKCVQFGNITLAINLYDEENDTGADDVLTLYETIFRGNPIVKDVRTAIDHMGTKHGFIRFQPEVISSLMMTSTTTKETGAVLPRILPERYLRMRLAAFISVLHL